MASVKRPWTWAVIASPTPPVSGNSYHTRTSLLREASIISWMVELFDGGKSGVISRTTFHHGRLLVGKERLAFHIGRAQGAFLEIGKEVMDKLRRWQQVGVGQFAFAGADLLKTVSLQNAGGSHHIEE